MVSPRLVDTTIVAECAECGYMSNHIEDFIPLTSGVLCHSCYDSTVTDNQLYYRDEESRESRAFTDAINTDYLD